MVALIEQEVSYDVAQSPLADINGNFQNYINGHKRTDLASNVKILVLPSRDEIPLGEVAQYESAKAKHYYVGRDSTILQRFASDSANLFHVSQANPRRNIQTRFLQQSAGIENVPEKTIVDRVPSAALTIEEAMFIVRLRHVLLTEYFMESADIGLATMSHGVEYNVKQSTEATEILLSRNSSAVRQVVDCYRTAKEVFDGFVKEFARVHLYQHIRPYVPSSSHEGRDALYKRLMKNKDLFRVEETDYGNLSHCFRMFFLERQSLVMC